MGARRRGRELAFQILYQTDLGGLTQSEAVERFEDLHKAKASARDFALELSQGAGELLPELDALIGSQSKNWTFSRLASVDRALLRLGAFEILHREDVPFEVTLNECIELAKVYGTEESPAFINGILDQIRKQQGGAKKPGKKAASPRKKAKAAA